WVEAAKIFVGSRCREREAELVLGVERLRTERAVKGDNVVGDVIIVLPHHRRSGGGGDRGGFEARVVEWDVSFGGQGDRSVDDAGDSGAGRKSTDAIIDQRHRANLFDGMLLLSCSRAAGAGCGHVFARALSVMASGCVPCFTATEVMPSTPRS